MSAVVVPFKGEWQGSAPLIERAPAAQQSEARALHDARMITAAKRDNNDWTACLLLALLETLDTKQLQLLEFRLLGMNLENKSAAQALAIVQLANGGKAHRARVSAALGAREDEQ